MSKDCHRNISDLDKLSEACYNHSRTVANDIFYNRVKPSEVSRIENCFGWSYFETAFILSIIQIVFALAGVMITIYILVAIVRLNPLKMLKELNSARSAEELSTTHKNKAYEEEKPTQEN